MKTCVIFRTDKIGDLVCSLPAIYMCRILLPEHKIVLVASHQNISLVNGLEYIDLAIPGIEEFKKIFAKEEYSSIEYTLAFNQNKDVYNCVREINAPHSLGIRNSFETFFLFNKGTFARYPLQEEKTEAERMLHIVRNIDPKKFDTCLPLMPNIRIPYKESHKKRIDDFFTAHNLHDKEIICLNPIKEGSSKSVPDHMYAPLLKSIEENFPNFPIIVATTKDNEERVSSFIKNSECKNISLYIHNNDLLDCVALIDSISVFIGSSTGPTHIAALLNKNTIAFYPYDNKHSPERWGSFTRGSIKYILSKGNVDSPENQNHRDLFCQEHIKQCIATLKEYLTPHL